MDTMVRGSDAGALNEGPDPASIVTAVGVRSREAAAAVLAQDIRLREVKLEAAVDAHRRRVAADEEQARREDGRQREAELRLADAAAALDRRGHELELQAAQLRDRVAAAREQQLALDGRERELRWREEQMRAAVAEVTAARQRILAREAKFIDDAEMRAHLAAIAAASTAAATAAIAAASATTKVATSSTRGGGAAGANADLTGSLTISDSIRHVMTGGQNGSPVSAAVTPRWDRSAGEAAGAGGGDGGGAMLPTHRVASVLSTSSSGGGSSALPLTAATAAAFLPFLVAAGLGGGGAETTGPSFRHGDGRRGTVAPGTVPPVAAATPPIPPPPLPDGARDALGAAVMDSGLAASATAQVASDATRRERDTAMAARESRLHLAEEELKLKSLSMDEQVADARAALAEMSAELAAAHEALATTRALVDVQVTQAALKDEDYRRVYQQMRADLKRLEEAKCATTAGSPPIGMDEQAEDGVAAPGGSPAAGLGSGQPHQSDQPDALSTSEASDELLHASHRDVSALAAAVEYFKAAADSAAVYCDNVEAKGEAASPARRGVRSFLKQISIADRASAIATTALARVALLSAGSRAHHLEAHSAEEDGGEENPSAAPASTRVILSELLTTVRDDLRDVRQFIDMRRDALALEGGASGSAMRADRDIPVDVPAAPIKASHYSGRNCTVVAALALQLVERAQGIYAALPALEAHAAIDVRGGEGLGVGIEHPSPTRRSFALAPSKMQRTGHHAQQQPQSQQPRSTTSIVARYLDDVVAAAASGSPTPGQVAFRADGRVAIMGASISGALHTSNAAVSHRRSLSVPAVRTRAGVGGGGAVGDKVGGIGAPSPNNPCAVATSTTGASASPKRHARLPEPLATADPSFAFALGQLPPDMRAAYVASL